MNLMRLCYTLRPLRTEQWTDRILRPLRARLLRKRSPSKHHLEAARAFQQVSLPQFRTSDTFDPGSGNAFFLHLAHHFDPQRIDWNFSGHGKLWTYHLKYFGWLEKLDDAAVARAVMQDFCRRANPSIDAAEIYPTSRRIQHWIGALLRHGLRDEEILKRLYADAWRVARLPEYHLQANHLLQNALAIYVTALFFQDEELCRRAKKLLREELGKQFLSDGGHIERSASYTADVCARMLFCLHLQRHIAWRLGEDLAHEMQAVVARVMSWLDAYAFSDGSFAHIGDSSPDMMPTMDTLREAAKSLRISPDTGLLRESGYRKAVGKNWEALINVGSPAPPYQPGHAHADSLTFCLNVRRRPLLVDVGVSTYERSERRLWERSTDAHNTVTAVRKNSSDVWASFRMGRRACVKILREDSSSITASHDGYAGVGLRHVRTFDWLAEEALSILDRLEGRDANDALSFLHFHPDVQLSQTGENTWQTDGCRISFHGMKSVTAEPYQFAAGFNLLRSATRLRCVWCSAETEIRFDF